MIGEPASPKGRFDPLLPDHPGVGSTCPICRKEISAGDVPTLIEIGPADEEDADKAERGLAHNVEAAIAHEACAYPADPEYLTTTPATAMRLHRQPGGTYAWEKRDPGGDWELLEEPES